MGKWQNERGRMLNKEHLVLWLSLLSSDRYFATRSYKLLKKLLLSSDLLLNWISTLFWAKKNYWSKINACLNQKGSHIELALYECVEIELYWNRENIKFYWSPLLGLNRSTKFHKLYIEKTPDLTWNIDKKLPQPACMQLLYVISDNFPKSRLIFWTSRYIFLCAFSKFCKLLFWLFLNHHKFQT